MMYLAHPFRMYHSFFTILPIAAETEKSYLNNKNIRNPPKAIVRSFDLYTACKCTNRASLKVFLVA